VFLSRPLRIGGNEDCWEMLPNEARRAENRGRRPRAGWGSWGGDSKPHQLGDLGKRCRAPQRGSGGALTAKDFSLFSALRMASPDTPDIVLLWITNNEKFLTRSILSQLLCIWCLMFFLVYETKFIVGKWQVMVFTAGKRRGR